MRIGIATPAARRSLVGNRVTALRWAGLLRQLGHAPLVCVDWCGEEVDLLVAVHARKSHASIVRWREERGAAPLVVLLSGTDLYEDLPESREALRSLELADALVVLQPRAIGALPREVRHKARVIFQSATPPRGVPARERGDFRVAVVAHLRKVKDPFLAAEAARLLAPTSRVKVEHVGAALEPGMDERARHESASNPRWTWVGARPHGDTKRRVAAADLLALTSSCEGGANAVGEAVVCGTPLVCSRVDGSTGLLGDDHPGLFEPGDAAELAALLERCEGDAEFLAALRACGDRLRPLFEPRREREAWRALLRDLGA